MAQIKKKEIDCIIDMSDDDFMSMNDSDFKELHVCESDSSSCFLTSQYRFKNVMDAVEYLEENKIDSYLISICCKKDSK